MRPPAPDLFALYEHSVQNPESEVETIDSIYRQLNGRSGRSLREDFCGTGLISCNWVKLRPGNTAVGLDLDPGCLAYGERVHKAALKEDQRTRVSAVRQNVVSVTPPVDVVAACNFSWFIFHDRAALVAYFKAVRRSLAPGGVFAMDIVGGPDFVSVGSETTRKRLKGFGPYVYEWELKKFNPVQRRGTWAIHFKIPGRRTVRDAFTYDWRVWTLPEAREALRDAGFEQTHVFWEKRLRGRDTGIWEAVETAPADECWIAYLVGRAKT
ncbi:MAG TPA: class I SAM-dependent methyltransferase [Bdellovibrionota bacterium]|nr:class I SAM-dependent methyltransferase [Bdellovibrionota bacterium]